MHNINKKLKKMYLNIQRLSLSLAYKFYLTPTLHFAYINYFYFFSSQSDHSTSPKISFTTKAVLITIRTKYFLWNNKNQVNNNKKDHKRKKCKSLNLSTQKFKSRKWLQKEKKNFRGIAKLQQVCNILFLLCNVYRNLLHLRCM